MPLLLLLAVAGVVLFILTRPKRRDTRVRTLPSLPPDPPAPAPVTVRSAVEQVKPSPANVLQAFSPIPLTIEGASAEDISALRRILDDEHNYNRDRQDRLVEWLLTTNARVREIDEFIAEWGPKFAAACGRICESDPDWLTAGELDRDDIRIGASQKAAESFDVRVADLDYEVIAKPPAMAAVADDALLDRYRFDTLSFYFRNAADLGSVHVVPSDDYYRPRFENLVSKGLARRGAEIPPEALLQTMTLKDMETVAAGLEHKRFTRRARAVEFLSGVPDLRERLGRHVSLRECFQCVPLPPEFAGIDLAALSHAWAYAAEYAKLLETTYSTAAASRQAAAQAVMDEYFKGWLVEVSFGDEPCCPACAKQAGERRGARSAPRLPHHVGCSCHLSQIYE